MSPLASAIVIGSAWFAVFIVSHLAWSHVTKDSRYARLIVRCFVASEGGCVVTIAALHGRAWQGPPLSWLLAEGGAVFLMVLYFILYMPLIFVISSSLSVDSLLIIDNAGGALPREALYGSFASVESVHRRLESMRGNGLVTIEGDSYRITPKAERIARFFTAVKLTWKLWPGG